MRGFNKTVRRHSLALTWQLPTCPKSLSNFRALSTLLLSPPRSSRVELHLIENTQLSRSNCGKARNYEARTTFSVTRIGSNEADLFAGTRREGRATGHLDMLRAVLLASPKQGRAQGVAHVRYAARHQFARHQPRPLPHHHAAGGRAAT